MYQPNNGRRLHYATKSEAARLGFRHGDRARQEVRAPLGGEHAAGPQAQEQDLHGTYREACNELAKIQATRCDERAMPTVGQLYEARYLPWLERKYEGSESSTPNSYKRAWDSVCARRWADVPIDQIKPLEVQGWLDGMAYGNAHWALVVMRRTLDFAVNLDQIPANPFRRKYEMPRKSSDHQKNVYTIRQAEAMLSRVEGLPYEAAYILAAFGGCRTGESLAVRVEDVREIEAGGVRFAVASITKQAGNMNGEVVGRTKNAQSAREAIIPEPYCDALLRVRDQRAADGLKWLCMMGASQMGKAAAGAMWRTLGRIPFANLRNSWRTFAQFEWGVGYDTLELLMGHKLPGVTGQHYLCPSIEQLAEDFAVAYAEKRAHLG